MFLQNIPTNVSTVYMSMHALFYLFLFVKIGNSTTMKKSLSNSVESAAWIKETIAFHKLTFKKYLLMVFLRVLLYFALHLFIELSSIYLVLLTLAFVG